MKKSFLVTNDVRSAKGTQTWRVKAKTAEEARQIFDEGGGEFVSEEIEVQDIGDVEVSEEE